MTASAVSLVVSNHALTRASARSAPCTARISATAMVIRAPGRSTQARTFTGATGIAPRMSSTNRPTRNSGRSR